MYNSVLYAIFVGRVCANVTLKCDSHISVTKGATSRIGLIVEDTPCPLKVYDLAASGPPRGVDCVVPHLKDTPLHGLTPLIGSRPY